MLPRGIKGLKTHVLISYTDLEKTQRTTHFERKKNEYLSLSYLLVTAIVLRKINKQNTKINKMAVTVTAVAKPPKIVGGGLNKERGLEKFSKISCRGGRLLFTAQKIKFDQIPRFPRNWSHLLKKSLMENFIFAQC